MSANAGTRGTGGLTDFDLLPPLLRSALRDYPLCMDAGFALQKLSEGTSEAKLLAILEERKQSLSPFNPENQKRGM